MSEVVTVYVWDTHRLYMAGKPLGERKIARHPFIKRFHTAAPKFLKMKLLRSTKFQRHKHNEKELNKGSIGGVRVK